MPGHASAQPVPNGGTEDTAAEDSDSHQTALAHLRTYLATADALLPHIDGSHSPVLITSTDLSRQGPQILYANQAFQEMVGSQLGEILGDTLEIFQGPETDTDDLQAMRQELIRTGFARAELVRYRKNGDAFNAYVTASRMSDDAPGPGVFLFVENEVSPDA